MNSVDIPTRVGRGQDVNVLVNFTRASGSGNEVFVVNFPDRVEVLTASLPAGCTLAGAAGTAQSVTCTVNPIGLGTAGSSTLRVRGRALGGGNVTATQGASVAADSFSVVSGGDLTVLKTASPASGLINGQTVTFTLTPAIASGGDAVPAGGSVTITDQLPGTASEFTLSSVSAAGYTCNSVSSAQSTRTLSCTINGALASLPVITLQGRPTLSGSGGLVNNASIAADGIEYIDSNANNNTTQVAFSVNPGTDPRPTGSYPATSVTGTAQTFTLNFVNNGPQSISGGQVQMAVPAGFAIGALPAGCVNSGAGSVNGISGTVLTCTAGTVTSSGTQSFLIPLTNPATAASGNFGIGVVTGSGGALPGGLTDANTANNLALVPFSVVPPYADLSLTKTKSPSPVAAGTNITNTLQVRNNGIAVASFSAAGGGTPLRVIDDMDNLEEYVSASAGWSCTDLGPNSNAPTNDRRRVVCERTSAGTLAVNATLALTLTTRASATLTGVVALANEACTGGTALTRLGLAATDGPQPPDGDQAGGTDCRTATVTGTDVVPGAAQASIVKESSNDGTSWQDLVANAPTLASTQGSMFWRLTIRAASTTANPAQLTIPTLNVNDSLPAILNASSSGLPSYVTPAPVIVSSTVLSGSAGGSCTPPAAGASNLACSFTNVLPDTTVQVVVRIDRPFEQGSFTNTASLNSPNAFLTAASGGQLSDQAALIVQGRNDPAVQSKTVNPPNSADAPRVGQVVTYTIVARNLGPNAVNGPMTVTDTLDPTQFQVLTASAVGGGTAPAMPCSFVVATGVVTCATGTGTSVARYNFYTITISARLLKPATLPPAGTVNSFTNTATVSQDPAQNCEFRSTASASSSCNDANSTSNNSGSVLIDIKVPRIDVLQKKSRVLPSGQSAFGFSDVLRYRLRAQNNGPSRAEGIVITDRLNVPAGYSVSFTGVAAVNSVAAESGYTRDNSKTAATVSCSQSAPNADVVCTLASGTDNFLDPNGEVNFDLTFSLSGPSQPVQIGDVARICADETAGYETSGACVFTPTSAAGNNIAAVNEVVFPITDLSVLKTRTTPSPVAVNQPVSFNLRVQNRGPNDTTQIRLSDTLPPNFELVGSPSAVVGSFPSLLLTTLSCTPTPATLSSVGQQQVVNCVLSGSFPGSSDAANVIDLTLVARPKEGLFTGPYATDRTNTASVEPGQDGGGDPLAIDRVPANDSSSAVVQVSTTSLAGTVFQDRDRGTGNAGTPQSAAAEPRLAGVTITLSGTDAFGNAISRSTLTDASGNYSFVNLPPSGAAGYTLTQSQPSGFVNGPSDPPASGLGAPSAGGSYSRGGDSGNSSYSGVVLPVGTAATAYNFPELKSASLAGFVYVDRNDSGVRDGASDPAIAGATVRLLNAATGAVVATTTTAADGSYSFTGLDPLILYTLEQPLPTPPSGGAFTNGPVNPGLIDAAACSAGCLAQPDSPSAGTDRISGIDLSAGSDGTLFNFGEREFARLSGSVFEDRQRNAANGGTAQSAGQEPRIAGVTVTLTGTTLAGASITRTAVTDADGRYVFDNLPPSSAAGYTLTESQPAGFDNSPSSPPSSGGSAPSNGGSYAAGGAAGNSSYSGVVVNPRDEALRYDFPELRRPSLSGYVYGDRNANGQRDAALDRPIAGATVRLLDANTGALIATTTTDADGFYRFSNLDPLRLYTVEEPLPSNPAGLTNGPVNPGLIGGAACAAGCTAQPNNPAADTDRIAAIDLSSGVDGTQFNFGEREFGSLAGLVFEDRERAGTQGGSAQDPSLEPRLGGVTITLSGTDTFGNPVNRVTTTAPDGSYRFDDLFPSGPGGYTLTQTQPASHVSGPVDPSPGTAGGSYSAGGGAAHSVISGIVLNAGVNATGYLFPEVRRPTLSGSVYVDSNGNSARDGADAPIANATVRLLDATTGALVASTVTGLDGSYSFPDLDPLRRYTLEEPLPSTPPGLFNGPVNPGRIGGAFCVSGCTAQSDNPAANTDRIADIDLGKGQDGTGFDFGERDRAFIGGTVYIDRDRDGQLDPPALDGRLPGVTLTLFPGSSCSGTPIASTQTDASGVYTFGPLPAGLPYTICQTQPGGLVDGGVNPGSGASSAAANQISIASLPASGSSNNHFGERGASLAGQVWLDADNDGQREGGETLLAGVTLTLSGTDANGQSVNRTAVTDASGAYRFDDLVAAGPGGYTVTEQAAQPVVGGLSTLDGRSNPGSTGGTARAIGAGASQLSGIALPAGGSSTGNDFGEIAPSTLSGTVFIDPDNNGQQNLPADAGLSGVTLQITGTDDTGAPVNRTVVTDANGRYSLPDLRPGSYTIVQPTQPPGTGNGITSAGSSGGTASAVGTTPSRIDGVTLAAPGSASTGNNFAEVPIDAAIGGRVWLDRDNDGVLDDAEAGIAGVTIELSGVDNTNTPVTRTVVTDANGDFRFIGLPPGTYTLREPTQPPGTLNGVTLPGSGGGTASGVAGLPSSIGGIVLGPSQQLLDHRFGEIPPASLAGRVYADNNDNGLIDNGEVGLAGVSVQLTGSDDQGQAVTRTVQTDANGAYRFDDLRPGRYTVTEPNQPPGTFNGRTTPGSTGGTPTPVASTPSAIAELTLPVGVASVDNNFGEIGFSPDLRVSKRLDPATFTVNNPGRYLISLRNVGNQPSSGEILVTDRLPLGLSLAAPVSGAGWVCDGAAGATRFSCRSNQVLAAGATLADALTVPVAVAAQAAQGAPISNALLVEGGGEIPVRGPTPAERAAVDGDVNRLPVCSASIDHNACRLPTPVQLAAALSGTVWFDGGATARVLDPADRRLQGWIVEVIDPASGLAVATTRTGADGRYRIDNLVPGVELAVRFRDPASNVVFGYPVNGETAQGSSGANCGTTRPSSCVERDANPRLRIVLQPGQELPQQSLPVDPSGVVYDSGTRAPVPGSVVTLAPVGACPAYDPATQLVGGSSGGYTLNGSAASMTVGADGFYQFLFAPNAPARCQFRLTVTPPSGYSVPSSAIPPSSAVLDPSGGPASVFPVQPQAGPPTAAVGPGTVYHFEFFGGSAGANIIHNHIPLDPDLPTGLGLSKNGDRAIVEIGDSVRYRITVTASGGGLPRQTTVVDRLPAGFTYIPGTARVAGLPISDPAGGVGPRLAFQLGAMPATRQLVLEYRVRVGVGAQQGDGTNRAQAYSCAVPASCVGPDFMPLAGSVATNEGRHAVRVQGGVFGTEACVLGKVYVDCNGNHLQDREELGVPGVRLMLSEGTQLVSDSEGKYSICGLRPQGHVLRVDESTLPRGSRLTTSSNRNLGDAGSLWLDLKNGELHRADFIEGSCSNTVLEQVKARRAQGEVRAPEIEKKGGPALRFDSKAHGRSTLSSPQQGTDGANQQAPKPRPTTPGAQRGDERHRPTPDLPMNRPPPEGRTPAQKSDDANKPGGQDAPR